MSDKYLSMSDDDILNSNSPDDVASSSSSGGNQFNEAPVNNQEQEQELNKVGTEQIEESEEVENTPSLGRDDGSNNLEEGEPYQGSPDEEVNIDYKGVYEKIFKPFKANGKEITIDNPDDVVSLMQMGANYNKKMAALKPSMNIIKMLEKQDLLDEEKISYLIDISKHNPQALGKLIKDSQLDVYDLETVSDDYVPTSYSIPEESITMDNVLDSIQNTPTFMRLSDVIGKEWDNASRDIISKAPETLAVINDHMQNGIYDIISNEMEKQRILGKLNGLSDIEAYRKIGNFIYDQGGFNHIAQQQYDQSPVSNNITEPTGLNEDLRNKRRAVAPVKQSGRGIPSSNQNYLAMSDEAFEKMFQQQYK